MGRRWVNQTLANNQSQEAACKSVHPFFHFTRVSSSIIRVLFLIICSSRKIKNVNIFLKNKDFYSWIKCIEQIDINTSWSRAINDGQILPKYKTLQEGVQILELLSGKS